MKGSEVICLLVLLTVAPTTADNEEEPDFKPNTDYVSVSDTTVTLTCPVRDEVKWEKGVTNPQDPNENIISQYTDKDNGLTYCSKDSKKYYFYTKLKVCKGCVEMNTGLVIAIMLGDILFTAVVIFVVYVCAKRKAAPAPPQRAAYSRQAGAPPPPDPDYQRLNPATRSKDIYAEARRPY